MSGGRADCGRVCKEKSKSGRLWGARKTVRKKMNGVGGERTADGSAEKRATIGCHQVQGGGKEEDEWCQGGKWTADGFAEKRAKMRGVATQWVPEGNEWRIQTHLVYGASWPNAGLPDAERFAGRTLFFLLMLPQDMLATSSVSIQWGRSLYRREADIWPNNLPQSELEYL